MRVVLLVALLVLVSCGKNDNFVGRGQVPPPGVGVPGGPVPPGQYNPYGNPYGNPGGPYSNLPYGAPQNPYSRFAPPQTYGNPGMVPFAPVQQYMGSQWGPFWNQWQQYSMQRGYNPYNFNAFWTDFCPYMYGGNMPYWYMEFDQNWYGWVYAGGGYNYGPGFWDAYAGYPLPCSACDGGVYW